MIKQKLKYFISGFAVATLMFSTMTAFADSLEKDIKVIFTGSKIYVNGKLTDLRDAKGNKVEPMAYNGTNYLPVRAIAQALNQTVEWDAKNNSIYIGQRPELGTPNVWIDELDHLNVSGTYYKWDKDNDKANSGQSYQHGIRFKVYRYSTYTPSVEYLLDQKYKTFKGTIVLPYNDKNHNVEKTVKIYGDDELLYTSPVIKAGSLPVDFKVDTTGMLKLKIVVEARSYDVDTSYIGIVNAGLYE